MNKSSLITNTLLMALVLSLTACTNAQNDKAEQLVDRAAGKVDTAVDNLRSGAAKVAYKVGDVLTGSTDSNFVVRAMLDNNKQERLIQAALENGTDKDLKTQAATMMGDHKKLGSTIKAYSLRKGYMLPSGDEGKANKELETLDKKPNGTEWDKEWMEQLTSAYKESISVFEKGRDNVKDPELKSLAADALPTLNAHLYMINKMQDKRDK